jgi:hypothetical protein
MTYGSLEPDVKVASGFSSPKVVLPPVRALLTKSFHLIEFGPPLLITMLDFGRSMILHFRREA